jgi:hypothetical protein
MLTSFYHSVYVNLWSTRRKYEYALLKFRQDGWEVAVWTSSEIILHNVLSLQHSMKQYTKHLLYVILYICILSHIAISLSLFFSVFCEAY